MEKEKLSIQCSVTENEKEEITRIYSENQISLAPRVLSLIKKDIADIDGTKQKKMATITRKTKIPAIYFELPWIRKRVGDLIMADALEDLEYIDSYKSVIRGESCVSSIESLSDFIIKIDLPKEILLWNGNTGGYIQSNNDEYYWRIWDILYLYDPEHYNLPYEAVSFSEVGLSFAEIRDISGKDSCIHFLKDMMKMLKYTDSIEKEIPVLKKIEDRIFARMRIERTKSYVKVPSKKKSEKSLRAIKPKLRSDILNRDNCTCQICGNKDRPMEVHHIVPISLIDKMELSDEFKTNPMNLITICKDCNIGISDRLSENIIDMYIQKFDDKNHPNHDILELLYDILRLQEYFR